jgi:hypothetical protein
MKQIKGRFAISDTDFDSFNENLKEAINKLQNDKQEVEVQFKVNTLNNGQLVYSALVLGRVEL